MKWTIALTAGLATVALGLISWGLYPFTSSRAVLDQWEVANTEFKVRISVYSDREFPTPGYLYVFQSAPASSNNWYTMATVPTDQIMAERDGWVRFVDNRGWTIFTRLRL